nr:MAG TPA: hypothetical protein [Caudoviricetes sp.]
MSAESHDRQIGCTSAKVIQVVVTIGPVGSGVEGDPVREVAKYWSLDGKLLAQSDPYRGSIFSAAENAQKAHYGKTHATFRIDQDDIDKFTADGSLPGNEAGSAQ